MLFVFFNFPFSEKMIRGFFASESYKLHNLQLFQKIMVVFSKNNSSILK